MNTYILAYTDPDTPYTELKVKVDTEENILNFLMDILELAEDIKDFKELKKFIKTSVFKNIQRELYFDFCITKMDGKAVV